MTVRDIDFGDKEEYLALVVPVAQQWLKGKYILLEAAKPFNHALPLKL